MSKARELGWIGRPVRMDDILAAVTAHKLTFLMSSATQSNSGASAYLAMLAASFGTPNRLDARALDDRSARAKVKSLLQGVARTSGSSGWLADLYLSAAHSDHPFDAMWNYEAVLKQTNDKLRSFGGELLYAVYPADGTSYADVPLGYVDHGQDEDTMAFFTSLQDYLLGMEAQARIAALGRRIAPGRAKLLAPEKDWNFDPSRNVPSVSLPKPSETARALVLYQEVLRKPSLTALCLDFSGAMSGDGETQLKSAVHALFDPGRASQSLIQWTPQDRIFILPFDSAVRSVDAGDGTFRSQAALLAAVEREHVNGDANMYACAERALLVMRPLLTSGQYLPSIVIMTDGRSDHRSDFDSNWQHDGHAVPIFGITFGNADPSQLEAVADLTRARVFDGAADLVSAFRNVRSYN
jgi:Ca-activated chloride channel family protein